MKKILLNALYWATLVISSNAYADITSNLTHFTKLECSLKAKNVHKKTSHKAEKHSTACSLPHMAVEQGKSLNWSGYASAINLEKPVNNTVTAVLGTWTVPALKSTKDETYTAIWVGIDGYGSGTVEQLGTEHDWSEGQQVNSAWFEMYPNPSYQINNFPLNVGDVIQAEVEYKGNNQFQLSLVNHTQNTYTIIPASQTKSTVAKRSSAEWIVEAPYSSAILPLSDFQEIAFTNCEAVMNGLKGGIENAKWQTDALTMQDSNGVTKAVPSTLSGNYESFSVKWVHE